MAIVLAWLVTVPHSLLSGLAGAVRAAIRLSVRFETVTQDAAIAMRAARRERLDRAFEAVEGMRRAAAHRDRNGLVVLVSADFAALHWESPSCRIAINTARVVLEVLQAQRCKEVLQ